MPKSGPGTALPKVGDGPVWTRGSTVEAAWALYANHAGGYSYRLCKMSEDGSAVTEECFQRTPLNFVGTQTEIRYNDASKASVKIPAVTTSVGTYPKGSMCAHHATRTAWTVPHAVASKPAPHPHLPPPTCVPFA